MAAQSKALTEIFHGQPFSPTRSPSNSSRDGDDELKRDDFGASRVPDHRFSTKRRREYEEDQLCNQQAAAAKTLLDLLSGDRSLADRNPPTSKRAPSPFGFEGGHRALPSIRQLLNLTDSQPPPSPYARHDRSDPYPTGQIAHMLAAVRAPGPSPAFRQDGTSPRALPGHFNPDPHAFRPAAAAAAESAESGRPASPGAKDGGAHNKYCHFCQHIKVPAARRLRLAARASPRRRAASGFRKI